MKCLKNRKPYLFKRKNGRNMAVNGVENYKLWKHQNVFFSQLLLWLLATTLHRKSVILMTNKLWPRSEMLLTVVQNWQLNLKILSFIPLLHLVKLGCVFRCYTFHCSAEIDAMYRVLLKKWQWSCYTCLLRQSVVWMKQIKVLLWIQIHN